MQHRKLGRTDLSLSVIGLGGIVASEREPAAVVEHVRRAFDAGINYIDTGPFYSNSQELLGPAIEPLRDQLVLACKTTQRSAAGAQREMLDSLAKLRTDHFDIYQMHSLSTLEELDQVLAPDGAMTTFQQAKAAGITKLIGLSCHDEATALAAIATGLFDTILYPLNFVSYTRGNFGPAVLAAANARGMGVLALKAMAKTRMAKGQTKTYPKCWYEPEDDPHFVQLLLRWTLDLPGVTAAIPPGDPGLFDLALQCAAGLTPLDAEARAALAERYGQAQPLFTYAPSAGDS